MSHTGSRAVTASTAHVRTPEDRSKGGKVTSCGSSGILKKGLQEHESEDSTSSHDSSAFWNQADPFWRHKLGANCIATYAENCGLEVTVCTVVG